MIRKPGLLAAVAATVALSACGSASTAGNAFGRATPPSPSSLPVPGPSGTTQPGSAVAHVMLVVLENRERPDVIGNSEAPALNSLASRYGQATQAYATTHPSLPNYLELLTGSTFAITSDCTSCSVEGPTLVDQLDTRGIGWRAYMEGMSKPCDQAPSTDTDYAKKHDPFLYVRHLVADPTACQRVVPAGRLAGDLMSGRAPPFLWYTPNLCHDGHDCSTATMDRWVAGFIPSVLSSLWYAQGGVIVITFDEGSSDAGCCRIAHGGRTATLVISTRTGPRRRLTAPIDQAGILGTIEDLFGVGRLGDAVCPCAGNLHSLV